MYHHFASDTLRHFSCFLFWHGASHASISFIPHTRIPSAKNKTWQKSPKFILIFFYWSNSSAIVLLIFFRNFCHSFLRSRRQISPSPPPVFFTPCRALHPNQRALQGVKKTGGSREFRDKEHLIRALVILILPEDPNASDEFPIYVPTLDGKDRRRLPPWGG